MQEGASGTTSRRSERARRILELRSAARPAAEPLVVPRVLGLVADEISKHIPRDTRVYYVTDSVRCPYRRILEIALPETAYQSYTDTRMLVGRLVHLGLEMMIKQAFGDKAMVEYSDSLDVFKILTVSDGKTIVVRGRIDAILLLGDRRIGVEIKFTTSQRSNLPYPSHVLQAIIYNALYELDETRLVYVSPDYLLEYIVDYRPSEEELRDFFSARPEDSPLFDRECNRCPYRSLCPYSNS